LQLRFGPWFFLQKGGKAVKAFGPEARITIEPVHGLLHRRRREAACHRAAGLLARDQAGIRQHVEMLDDRRQRHRKRLGQLAYGDAFLLDQPRQQCAAGRVGKRRKGSVERGVLILNHTV
jgi:hypothetical protein